MKKIHFPALGIRVPVAIGAGLASALLYLVATKQGVASLALSQLAPLPVIIVTLGFSRLAGLAAVILGSCVVAGFSILDPTATGDTGGLGGAVLEGLIFAVLRALPAWWLGRAATAVIPESPDRGPWEPAKSRRVLPAPPADAMLGRLIIYAAVATFVGVALIVAVNSLQKGSYEASMAVLTVKIEPLVQSILGTEQMLAGLDAHKLARLVAYAAWPVFAGFNVAILMANVWLGGRAVQISNRLRRPWPDIPRELNAPRILAPIFAVALGLWFAGGLAGALGMVAAAAIAVAFALQGLAVVHDLTRGKGFRLPLLCGIYLLLGFLMPWPLIVFTLIGLVEAGFSLRGRKAASAAKQI